MERRGKEREKMSIKRGNRIGGREDKRTGIEKRKGKERKLSKRKGN